MSRETSALGETRAALPLVDAHQHFQDIASNF